MPRWIAAAGAFLVSLDSVVNIAFPAIAAAFGAPAEGMRWVIVSYVFIYAILSFAGGALGDVVGHGRVFTTGVAVSVAGFLVCGTAPVLAALLAGRALQGLGAGLVYGTAPGILTLADPTGAKGRAAGFFSAALGLALTAGPLVAGALVDAFGWRSVFLFRAPLALALLVWALAALPRRPAAAGYRLVGVRDVGRARVVAPAALSFVANGGIFAIWLLVPFFLASTRGLGAAASGLLFMLTPLGMTLAAPLAVRLTERVGVRALVAGGLLLEASGLGALSYAASTTPLAALGAMLFLAGLGIGLFQVPNMASVMAAFGPGQQGAAGGLAFLARTLGVVTGVLALGELVAVRRDAVGFGAASAEAFMLAALAVAAAGALAVVARAAAPAASD
jgi:DHA2 family methylenomycin A resistance protein-like MFS transporter